MHASLRPSYLLVMALLTSSFTPAEDTTAPAPRRTFLGVHVTAVPPEVRAQTDLEEGAGLLIDFIQPKSPAEAAGIQQFDILLKVGDQRVLSQEQFGSLIRGSTPGQELNLTVLRRGKELPVKVALGDAPLVPDKSVATSPKSSIDAWLMEMLKSRPDAQRLIEEAMKNWPGQKETANAKPGETSTHNHSICRTDSEGAVEITQRNSVIIAKVKDSAGKVIFEGPINTKAERDVIDPAILARIEDAEKSAKSIGGSR